jgi:RNA polymerase sigma-70 factor (ECF subfamily)
MQKTVPAASAPWRAALFGTVLMNYHCIPGMRSNRKAMAGEPNREPPDLKESELDQRQDVELIRAVAQRDRRAFEALYYRHAPRIGRYLMRLLRQPAEVEEALNDVMLVIWQSAARFDPALSRLTTWLFGIAHNKALKVLARLRARSVEVSAEPLAAEDSDADPDANTPVGAVDVQDPERTLLSRELGDSLVRALDQLSPEHRSVIQLAFGEDCSYQEIAAIIGSPVNTVKTRVFHARKRLAAILRHGDLPSVSGA